MSGGRYVQVEQGFLTWGAGINFRGWWEGHICGGQNQVLASGMGAEVEEG